MVRVAMRILGSRTILRARGAPRKLTISMNTLGKRSIAAPAAASPGSASSAASADGIAGSAAASGDSASTAAALDQGSVEHYFDEVFENEYFNDGDDNKVLFERGRHPHYNKVIVKGNHDRVKLHGAAKHAKVVVKGDHDQVDISNGHHGKHGKHGHRGKHGHHRHHGRGVDGEEDEDEEGLDKREAGVFAVAGSSALNGRSDDGDFVSGASVEDLAARSPRHRDHDRHRHHHHGGHRHDHHWDDRSVDGASLRLSVEDRSIEDKVIGDAESLESHLEDRSPHHGHHGHHKKHHGHRSKDKALVVKGDNKTVDVHRREIEGAKGRVDIMVSLHASFVERALAYSSPESERRRRRWYTRRFPLPWRRLCSQRVRRRHSCTHLPRAYSRRWHRILRIDPRFAGSSPNPSFRRWYREGGSVLCDVRSSP